MMKTFLRSESVICASNELSEKVAKFYEMRRVRVIAVKFVLCQGEDLVQEIVHYKNVFQAVFI